MTKFFFFLIAFFSFGFSSGQPTYQVIKISDGDTFTILKDNKQVRVRIDAIDAPEKGMPYGNSAKQFLAALCFQKNVRIISTKEDRYGRIVARAILPNGKDISTEMIRAGFAWHYKKYSSDVFLAKLEVEARKNKRGLWQDPNPIAPWEVRKMHRKGISTRRHFENSPR